MSRVQAPHGDDSEAPQPRGGGRLRVWRLVRRIAVLLAGITAVVGGMVLLVLPGPGLLAIAAGLSLLATEFLWARRLLQHLQGRLGAALAAARGRRWQTWWFRRPRRGRARCSRRSDDRPVGRPGRLGATVRARSRRADVPEDPG